MNLYLKEPSLEDKLEIIKMCEEISQDNKDDNFEGMSNLKMVLTDGYEKWLEQNEMDKHIENLKPEWSNATNYILVDSNGHVYGCSSLRHHLKGDLLYIGGNIGYGIRPSERGKGYGTIQLMLLLEKAHELGLDEVLLTCRENNIGSKKTIEKCSYKADEPVQSRIPGILELRYWADVVKTLNLTNLSK